MAIELIVERFPEREADIRHLYQENEDFQEMCQDYNEVSMLLVAWAKKSSEVNATTIEDYQTLLKELEAEIRDLLIVSCD